MVDGRGRGGRGFSSGSRFGYRSPGVRAISYRKGYGYGYGGHGGVGVDGRMAGAAVAGGVAGAVVGGTVVAGAGGYRPYGMEGYGPRPEGGGAG